MEQNLDFPRLSSTMKWVLLPIMFIWWVMQLICFGGFFVMIVAIMDIFEQIGTKKEDRDWSNTWYIFSAPFTFPVIWWVRYWKFGEYNMLE